MLCTSVRLETSTQCALVGWRAWHVLWTSVRVLVACAAHTIEPVQSGTDWVACGQCHRWQHIACDPRSGLGDLKQFADSGKVFSCVDCSKIKADQVRAIRNCQSTYAITIMVTLLIVC